MSATPQGKVLIGMEVHVQLNTATKCFSSSPYHFGADPNTLVDPIVLGLPGALPVLNREAVRLAIRTGLALGCEIAEVTKWDRKSYFYPDLPKGYQISQYDQPLCVAGGIEIEDDEGKRKRIRITRAHLEEDTGKSTHEEGGDQSRVDLNRAGAPLLEIVSEPDLASAGEALRYLDALREIVAYVGTSEGNMEEGHLRCEPNINIVFDDGGKTAIVEVKNLNSVRNVGRAIEYETARQTEAYLERGETLANTPRSTRGWDDANGVTVHQRHKESEDDYRYFPEPDLPPLTIARSFVETERAALPELPRARRARYRTELGLSDYDAAVLTGDPALAAFFEHALAGPEGRRDAKALANLIQGELLRHLNEHKLALDEVAVTPEAVGELIDLQAAGTINARTAKALFRVIVATGHSPAALVDERGLGQVSERSAVEAAVRAAMAVQARAVEEFRAGNAKARGRIFGESMQQLGGRGDPTLVDAVLSDLLG